jgi:hypothetical protein
MLVFFVLAATLLSDAASGLSASSGKKPPLQIAFVTSNKMKVKEVESILKERFGSIFPGKGPPEDGDAPVDRPAEDAPHPRVRLRVLDVSLPEIQEVDTAAIAKNKCLLAAQMAGGPVLTEDTSLHFHALGGMPGPYIKWFQNTLKCEGTFLRSAPTKRGDSR